MAENFSLGDLISGSQPYDIWGLISYALGREDFGQSVLALGTKEEERRAQELNQQRLNALMSGIDDTVGRIGAGPTFTLDNIALTGPSAGGVVRHGNVPDLKDIFTTGQTGLNAFRRLFPSESDLTIGPSGARGDLASVLGQSRESIGDLTQGGIDRIFNTLDTDLSDVLTANLAGIGEQSAVRQQQAQTELASQAGFFGGLENVQRQSADLGFQEAQRRGSEAATERGRIRVEEAGLQGEAARLSNALTAAQISEEGALSRTEADVLSRLSALDLERETGNINRILDRAVRGIGAEVGAAEDTQQQGLTAIDLLLKNEGMDLEKLRSILSAQLGLGQILGGSGNLSQDTISILPFLQNLMSQSAARDAASAEGDYGGVGGGLGLGLGALLAVPTGGLSLGVGAGLGYAGGSAIQR